jgi:hypothetical protein
MSLNGADGIRETIDAAEEVSANAIRLEAEVARLAGLSDVDRVYEKRTAAKQLGISLAELTKLVNNKIKRNEVERRCRTAGALETEAQAETANAQAEEKVEASNVQGAADELYESAKSILEADDPLAKVDEKIEGIGYAGDRTPVKLIYIAVLSGPMLRPINLYIQGPSAVGKNFAIDTGLKLHPPEAVHKISASSPLALVYSGVSFKHITIVIGESDSIPTKGAAASAIRSIAEDSVMVYPVVEKNPETNQYETREVVKEGPTNMIVSGVKPLEWQMGTRFITADIPDDPEQTLAVLLAEADAANQLEDLVDPSLVPYHATYRWLSFVGEKRVAITFARSLARLMPCKDVRVRRDFKQVMMVTKTIAFFAQVKRSKTSDGWVVATLQDYERARALLAPSLDAHLNNGVSDAVRQTVDAVKENETVSLSDLGKRMGVVKSTAHYRAKRAIADGYLVNVEERKGHPMKLKQGDPMPSKESALPTITDLEAQIEKDRRATQQSGSPTVESEKRAPFEFAGDEEVTDI